MKGASREGCSTSLVLIRDSGTLTGLQRILLIEAE